MGENRFGLADEGVNGLWGRPRPDDRVVVAAIETQRLDVAEQAHSGDAFDRRDQHAYVGLAPSIAQPIGTA